MHPSKPFQIVLQARAWRRPMAERIAWIGLLSLADRTGRVIAPERTVAQTAGVRRDRIGSILADLCQALPAEVVAIPGGWQVLRFRDYEPHGTPEDRKECGAARQRRWIAKRLRRIVCPSTWGPDSKPKPDPIRGGKIPVTRWAGPNDAHRRLATELGLDCTEQARRMRVYYADNIQERTWEVVFAAWLRRVAK